MLANKDLPDKSGLPPVFEQPCKLKAMEVVGRKIKRMIFYNVDTIRNSNFSVYE